MAQICANSEKSLVIRDLQTLLQKTTGENVSVVSYKAQPLVDKGEHFSSTMLKVDVAIKKIGEESQEEVLHLVAKMIPLDIEFFDPTASFVKEIFVFEDLIPTYKKLEISLGVKNENLLNIGPKFYGGRLSLNVENPNEADEDAVILLENLNAHRYHVLNKHKDLDLAHAKAALKKLAHFHAIGLAMHVKNPSYFHKVEKTMKICPYLYNPYLTSKIQHMSDVVCKDPQMTKYKSRITEAVNKEWEYLENLQVQEPWISLIHGDFWINNMLFREENDKIDVKFVDFQLSTVGSPMKDLPYFLSTSVSIEDIEHNFDSLIDYYYEELIGFLKILKCDTSAQFTKESFDDQLKKDASNELLHCMISINLMNKNEENDAFITRMRVVVNKFVEKGWL